MAIHVVNEARRCLHCKKPMCREGCPISTNIPEAIELFRTGHKEEAGEMLYENNPLSVICSLVCDHEKQCEGHCVLGRKGAPVHFSSIENYISDAYLDHLEPEMEPKKGQRVAIIGSGPAGITISVLLARRGQLAKLAPLATAWVLSLAAPVSWMVLSKAHAAIHTHLVPMLWHFALVPVSCLALVVMTKEIVSLLFRRRPDLVASH